MALCPSCQTPITGDFGLVNCESCGHAVFLDIDGEVQIQDNTPWEPEPSASEKVDEKVESVASPVNEDIFIDKVSSESQTLESEEDFFGIQGDEPVVQEKSSEDKDINEEASEHTYETSQNEETESSPEEGDNLYSYSENTDHVNSDASEDSEAEVDSCESLEPYGEENNTPEDNSYGESDSETEESSSYEESVSSESNYQEQAQDNGDDNIGDESIGSESGDSNSDHDMVYESVESEAIDQPHGLNHTLDELSDGESQVAAAIMDSVDNNENISANETSKPVISELASKNQSKLKAQDFGFNDSEVPAYSPEDLSEIADFGNSEKSQASEGSLCYRIKISDIDSQALRDSLEDILSDSKFLWDEKNIISEIKEGVLVMRDISPAKAIILIHRLREMPLNVYWESYGIQES